jgi:predicted PurR-regulated permease PerM
VANELEYSEAIRKGLEVRFQFWSGLFLRLAFYVLIGYLLWRLNLVVTTVIISGVLAAMATAIADPLSRIIRRYTPNMNPHTLRTITVALAFIAIFGFLYFSVQLLFTPIQTEIKKLVSNAPAIQAQFEQQVLQAKNYYANFPPYLRDYLESQKDNLTLPGASDWLASIFKKTATWAGHLVEVVTVPVLAFYFALDGKRLRNQFLFLVPAPRRRQALAILSECGTIMRAYLVTQFWLALIAGVLTGFVLKITGMEYALILGLFAGLTRAIPFIGPPIGGIPVVLMSFIHGAQTGNPYLWVWILVFFTLLHIVESKVIMPLFLGHALNLHAVIVLISLLIGGEFFGLMGMFLAAPVAALARVLLYHYFIAPQSQSVPKKGRTMGTTPRLERAVRRANEFRSPTLPTAPSTTANLSYPTPPGD